MLPEGLQRVNRLLLISLSGAGGTGETFAETSAYLEEPEIREHLFVNHSLHPALLTLNESFPNAHITLLTREVHSSWLTAFPKIQFVTPQTWNLELVEMPSNPQQFVIANLNAIRLIEVMQKLQFDAVVVFTAPTESPFAIAYLCYLAGIPIRIGQSQEFGGSVLSICVKPPLDSVPLAEYYLHLLKQAGISSNDSSRVRNADHFNVLIV